MSAELRRGLQADVPSAMKAKDAARVSVLRTALAALSNAEAVDPSEHTTTEVARRDLSDEDIRHILVELRDELRGAEEEMRRLDRPSEAEDLSTKAAILEGYLRAE
jgi:hypothetical protein